MTEGVIRAADVPVLAVRGADDVRTHPPFETIVVPMDGSDHAGAALERGIDLTNRFDATLHVLTVIDASPVGPSHEGGLCVERLEAGAHRVLEEAAERATAGGVEDVVTETAFGSIYRGITDYARDEQADLIVAGTHGRSTLDRLLLGSVTERVLRTAPAPVLTVRSQE